jgi:putative ABC transport system permease protein
VYVLLAFSVVVSLSAWSARSRSGLRAGILRTIGMTRRHARLMIRHESVITALIAAALGVRGISLAMLLVKQALSRYDIAISTPDLVAFTAAMAASTTLTQIDELRGSRLMRAFGGMRSSPPPRPPSITPDG